MAVFVQTEEFKNMNIGFALDEGMASENGVYRVFNGERTIWQIHFKISGNGGHGSILHKNTAAEKLNYVLTKMLEHRTKELKRMEMSPELNQGDVTTINLTRINGGVVTNVVPPYMVMVFDIRLAVDVDLDAFQEQINDWCKEAGDGIELEFETKYHYVVPTKTDESNPFWVEIEKAFGELCMSYKKEVFVGGTDSQYLREIGIPAIGFSPIVKEPILLHDHDEYLTADTYLRGIEIYEKVLTRVANT